jgi:hypothetical protein
MCYRSLALCFLSLTVTASAAHVDCAFVPTVGDMVALGSHGCHLDSPATGFIQRDFLYSAQSANGNPVPNPFSLGSSYFGGHNISGLRAVAGDTLTVTFDYTYETGTDRLSLLSATIISPETLPLGTGLTTDICAGSAFGGSTCVGALSTLMSSASGVSKVLGHEFDTLGPLIGVLGFRQVLTLPGGPNGQDYSLKTSGVITRASIPEPLPVTTSSIVLVALLFVNRQRKRR